MPRQSFFVVVVLAVVSAACADPSGPSTHEHAQRLLIAGTEEGSVVVDIDWRGIIKRSGPRFVAQGPTALSARGSGEVITVGRMDGGALVVAGLGLESGLELWRTTVSQGNTPVLVDGVEFGASIITANPSRAEVFFWRASQNGVQGIVGYDYERRHVTRFFGPVGNRFRAMAAIPSTLKHPDGCLAMAVDADLDPGPGLNIRAALHVACGTDYADRDSIPIALPSRQVIQMEMLGNGRELLVMTDLELLKFDILTMNVTSRASRPMSAPFFVSRATGRLILPDVGTSVVASTGIIYLLDANMELSSIIDLRVLPFGERPLGIMGAEESRDGRWLYIVGGVPRDGPLYGPEETHVLVIEKATGLVVDTVQLKTFGGSRPILMP